MSNVINQSPELLLLLLGASTSHQISQDDNIEKNLANIESMTKRAHSAEDLRNLTKGSNMDLNNISKDLLRNPAYVYKNVFKFC